ncbi:MAG: ferrous iron transport protein A [Sphaerochaetaceae bacterium]|jgi:Fe2+ transport system protein FeoA|nr:ferrous iron transport protein A [Sphaerochaetaceae bacterium]
MNNKTVEDLNVGQSGIISAIDAPKEIKRRLMDMGFTRGIRVDVIKKAPMGDPLEVGIRGYNICIRKEQAANLMLKESI